MLYIYIAVTPRMADMANRFIQTINQHVYIGGYRLIYDTFDDCEADKINTLKMQRILYVAESLRINDNLLKLDIDMIVNDHPQKIFDDNIDSDILVTTRQYKCKHLLNAGTVGYRINSRSLEFLIFFNQQLHSKSWKPYVDYQIKHNRQSDTIGWWDEQDLLCTMWENREKLPFDVTMKDAGPKWNWCAECVDELIEVISSSEYHILHFKGDQKAAIR